MDIHDLQRNFKGYLNTPLLWHGEEIYDLQQLVLNDSTSDLFTQKIDEHLRLGKLVERFVSYQLVNNKSYNILAENTQIQNDKRTIGELDILLKINGKPVHLEIVYKFYLYNPDENKDELSHWIGPNRKDTLVYKLMKLKEKQLPLLYHPKTQPLIESLELDIKGIKQQVLFKAQLFLPYNVRKPLFFKVNPECVKGFYIQRDELRQFETSQFYIPEKINWLMEAHDNVAWLNYENFEFEILRWLDKKIAPLCWLKQNGVLQKFFLVWW